LHCACRWKECEERYSQRHPSHWNPDTSAYPMNPFRHIVTVGHNARLIIENRRPTEREVTLKQQSEGHIQHDALYWCWARSNPPPGCLWQLWQSASTLTGPFHPNGIFFRWWLFEIEGALGYGPSRGSWSGGSCNSSRDSIHWLTCNRGNVESRLQWGLPSDERLAGCRGTVQLGMVQYSVYAVLSVCCTLCMLYSLLTHDYCMARLIGIP